jgi:hypothetical protein
VYALEVAQISIVRAEYAQNLAMGQFVLMGNIAQCHKT